MRSDHGAHGGGTHGAGPDLLEEMGYETRDITLSTIAKWLVGLFVFIGITTGGTILLYRWFVPPYAEMERVAPLAHVRHVPPIPQLQPDPRADMSNYREAEDAVADEYTTGGKKGVPHTNLPVNKAIDLLAAQGINGVSGSAAKPESPAYPGSGIYRERGAPTPAPADRGQTGDTMNLGAGGANALREGTPGAGGTGQDRVQSVSPNEPQGAPTPTAPVAPGPMENGTNR